ncbi:MAG TPA: endonuclease/exonuclease/phosphatase family protein [Fontimonas sp.]
MFKVLTLNIHKGFSTFNRRLVLHELRDAVRATDADVVFLQEVIGEHALHSTLHPRWPQTSHYEFLADSTWSDYAYGRNAVYPEGHHGNALLSKYPIRRYANHDISVAGREPRGLLHCVVAVPGLSDELHLVCVHLDLHARQRRRQLGLLCELIDREVPPAAPLVIAGDFNDWTLHAHDRLRVCSDLREVFVERHGKAARTFPARWPLLRLDRIYVRNVQVRSEAVLKLKPWSHLSDHAGLLAEIAA